jgi:hypothetical protein
METSASIGVDRRFQTFKLPFSQPWEALKAGGKLVAVPPPGRQP